jgi:hypothetical protein
VTNSGTLNALTGLTLTVDSVGTAAGFGLSGNTCATLPASGLAPGASCTANVTFVPTSAGQLTGTLVVTSSNGANPAKLSLGGIGFDFRMIVVGSATGSVVQGQTAYFTLAVTPVGGTSGIFSFQCANVPKNALCLFNPSQLNSLPVSVSGNVVVGIATGAPTTGKLEGGWRGPALMLCGVLALPLIWVRRKEKVLLGVVLLVALVSCVSSCAGSSGGSGGSGGGPGGQQNPGGGTPPGSYTVPVTATSAGVTHSSTVTVVVN